MKVVKKVLSIIAWVLIGIIIIYNIYNFVSIRVFKNELPTVGGYAQLKVISGSMEPTIDIGDMIVINTKYSDYKEKDIITFKDAKGSYVTHRIIEITKDGYATKGDNNNSIDQGYITNDDIVGKFVFRIKFLGVILDSFQNPITMILIMIMGIILCFLISTDKDGIPKDITKEKEFIEFLEAKRKSEKNIKKAAEKTKESNSKTNSKKPSTKSTSKKKEETDKQKEKTPKKNVSETNTTSPKKKSNRSSEKDNKTTTKKTKPKETSTKTTKSKKAAKESKKATISKAKKEENKKTTRTTSNKKKSSNATEKDEKTVTKKSTTKIVETKEISGESKKVPNTKKNTKKISKPKIQDTKVNPSLEK